MFTALSGNLTKRYELIAIPLAPIGESELPDLLAHVVANVQFGSLAFAQEKSLDPQAIGVNGLAYNSSIRGLLKCLAV